MESQENSDKIMATFPIQSPTGPINLLAYQDIAMDMYMSFAPYIILPSVARNIIKYNLPEFLEMYGDTQEMADSFFIEFRELLISKGMQNEY